MLANELIQYFRNTSIATAVSKQAVYFVHQYELVTFFYCISLYVF